MFHRLKTLARETMIYGFGSVAAKVVALIMLPLYVHYLSPADYGISELVMVIDLFLVAIVKLGLQNSMMRFFHDEERDRPGRGGAMVVRTVLTIMGIATLVATIVIGALAPQIAGWFFHNPDDVQYVAIMVFGLWTMNIYQTLTATYRLEKRPVTFLRWMLSNVTATVIFTVLFVVVFDLGAAGLLMGNFLGTAVLIPFVAIQQRRYAVPAYDRRLAREMMHYGVPTMPMAIAFQGLTLIDRTVLTRTQGLHQVGIYALAARLAQVVLLVVIALQMSWQPFAYSIKDDEEARRVYSAVMTWYVAVVGWIVVATALLAEPIVHAMTRPAFYGAARAVPLLALAAGLYGMYFIAGVGAGRKKATQYHIFVALGALVMALGANLALAPTYGYMGSSVAAMLANGTLVVLMILRSQHVFHVPYAWGRMSKAALVITAGIVLTYALPAGELWTLAPRIAGILLVPVALLALGFFPEDERVAIRRRLRRKPAR